jgi:hypothetical protein
MCRFSDVRVVSPPKLILQDLDALLRIGFLRIPAHLGPASPYGRSQFTGQFVEFSTSRRGLSCFEAEAEALGDFTEWQLALAPHRAAHSSASIVGSVAVP